MIGQEAIAQIDMAGEEAGRLVGCVGGGSNFGGLIFPFVGDKLKAARTRRRGRRADGLPDIDAGQYAYDFGDTAGLTPLMKMHTLGHDFIPDPMHAGGLRYHGSRRWSAHSGPASSRPWPTAARVFDAAVKFARTEGILPAPEPAHAIARGGRGGPGVQADRRGEVILFRLCGHGNFDIAAYDAYLAGGSKTRSSPRARWPTRSSDCPRRRQSPSGYSKPGSL